MLPTTNYIPYGYESVPAIAKGMPIYQANDNTFSANIVIKLTWINSLLFGLMISSIQSRKAWHNSPTRIFH